MPKPMALPCRGRLDDDYAVNLTIVEVDGFKLLNCLTPSHSALQRIENIFKLISVGRRGDLSPLRSGYPHRGSPAPARRRSIGSRTNNFVPVFFIATVLGLSVVLSIWHSRVNPATPDRT